MTTVIAVALLSISALAQTAEHAASGGRIQGRVVDASGGAIAASIRVIQTGTDVVIFRVRADQTGSFRTEQLRAGSYTVTAWDQGFRRLELARIAVQDAAATDLGDIRLDLSGCDAPGVVCDSITDAAPHSAEAAGSSGYVRLKLTCGADIDRKGKVHCPDTPDNQKLALPQGVDIRFASDGVNLWLVSVNGTTMSTPNSSHADCRDAKYSDGQLRIDGLGPGVDFCVRTKRGAVSHLFFTSDIEKHNTEITLWHVTRKR